ncbi:MAG: hypothetical protein ACLUHB_11445 [Odoribacter splanchnicus]
MVSDNRWVATTKGIVVFLLTALLFVFWYDRDRELAESHVTAVRFGFYRVIWIEVLCGIAVAWCVRKKFRFRLPDAGVLLLGDMSCCVRFMGMGWSVIGQNYGFCL